MTAEQLNPSLAVECYFSVMVDGDNRRTKLDLAAYPDIAGWLLTILDHVLYRQGRLQGERHIAAPPGGAALQKLIDGHVILAGQRPDGGTQLRLNPDFDVRLWVHARRQGECAVSSLLALAENPDLTRWLLNYCIHGPSAAARQVPSPELAASLRRYAALVDRLPPAAACYPDPERPADIAAELSGAARVFRQPAGAAIPQEVRQALGRHTPALPPGQGLLWGEDAGTGMVYPSLWNGRDEVPEPGHAGSTLLQQRRGMWDAQREAARASLRVRRYAALREIIPPAQQGKVQHYVRQLVDKGYFPALGDGQVELRSAIHNEPTIASLHHGLAGIVSSVCGETVIASYCYLSCYEEGAVLARHKDRPQCAYNLSLVLDMQCRDGKPQPWPIYLELDDKPEAVLLQVGDGLAYSGTEIWHWREALPPGYRAIVCFFHFVPQGFTGSLD